MALYSYSTKRRRIIARVNQHLEWATNSISNEPHTESDTDHAVFSPLRASTNEDQILPGSDNLLTRILNSVEELSERVEQISHQLRQNSIVHSVEELSERVEQISHQVRQNSILLQNLSTQGVTPAAVPDGLVLPLKSQEEVTQLEEGLVDEEFRIKVIQHFACIGGDSVSSLVRRILKRMLSAELALSYNFSGVKGKNSFHSLQMRGVLIAAVRRTFHTASEADVDAATRKWFSNARDRDGGRTRRTSDGNRDI